MVHDIRNRFVATVAMFVFAAGVVELLASRQQAPVPPAVEIAALKGEGMVVYNRECAPCHGADGQGDGAGPPLNEVAALSNKDLVIRRILAGAPETGMDPYAKVLNDRQVAAVATFVRTAWENAHGIVLETDVKPVREQIEKDKKK